MGWDRLLTRGGSYLEQYAIRYDTVEVDRWFWSLFDCGGPTLPTPADVADGAAGVGEADAVAAAFWRTTMRKTQSPYSFITPTAFRTLLNDPIWTVETVAKVSKPSSTGWGNPDVGSHVRYIYDNLTPAEMVGLLQVIAERPEEYAVAVYKQNAVRKADWVQRWMAMDDE